MVSGGFVQNNSFKIQFVLKIHLDKLYFVTNSFRQIFLGKLALYQTDGGLSNVYRKNKVEMRFRLV